ncbi:Gfo/Idh/MocA family oxidoreductase [Sporichthya sp.]|uniref:Gfo/Idh/MocA family protein n=1 Tax=Sporichthya sp. TaxID=65475 RepID=UPI0017B205B0|nr:Gfo/Idh/MocA family oxidoreductase [Sporichthya sp.]MBA3741926.1 Gfo/Idh/MocA family oxidoreductase [Sporichthya sp.]
MSELAVGLVGFGRWGRLIHRDLRVLGAAVHVAVPSPEGREAALAAGAAGVCADAGELPDLDGYVVAPPTVLHAAVLETLTPRGRPIFVEKPMTNDVAAAARLVEQAGDRIFVMDKWRYHPGVQELGRLARDRAFGRVLAIRSYRLGWGNAHKDVDAVWILLPHDLSIVLEMLGTLPAVRTAFAPDGAAPGSDLVCTLRDAGGPHVTCEISVSHPVNRRSVVVIGEEGSGQLGDSYDDAIVLAGRVGGQDVTEQTRVRPVGTQMPLAAELAAFLDHLQGGPPPRSSAAEGLAVVRAVDTARRLAGLA